MKGDTEMYLVCFKCYTVFNGRKLGNLSQCPNVLCGVGELHQIDELLIPAIIALNKKGYETKLSCSTHILRDTLDKLPFKQYGSDTIYIQFKGDRGIILPSAPEGFDITIFKNSGVIDLRSKSYEGSSIIELQRYTFSLITQLSEWADSLPISK